MEYNWLQALEMVDNGQPMHAPDENKYIYMERIENGSIVWFHKEGDKYKETVRVSHKFVNSTFEPYHKQIELTEDEKVILRNVDGKLKYIVREKGGTLWLFECKPIKYYSTYTWDTCDSNVLNNVAISLIGFNHLFQGIKWEDAEPRFIADLIKE